MDQTGGTEESRDQGRKDQGRRRVYKVNRGRSREKERRWNLEDVGG